MNAKPVIFQFSVGEKWMQGIVDLKDKDETRFKNTIRKLSFRPFDLLKQNQTPHAILITDSGITKPENRKLSRQVIDYARGGGTVILIFSFSSLIRFDDFTSYMKEWDLPWKIHSYTRIECIVNTSAAGPPGMLWMNGLPATYCSKSVYLSGVAPKACWYLPAPPVPDEEGIGMRYQAPPPGKETPFAFSKVGKGFLGFTGDVSQHEATDGVIFAMLRMNDRLQWCTCGNERSV
ncbi:hypothetical protein AAE478_009298 [Parahypoxylon ruwenzoriense]